jgi:amino acid adenylation domain-containing protein
MSFAQQRLWFLDQVAPGNPFYNIPLVLPFQGRLDRGVVERAVNEIVRRHESLRTTFRLVDGEPAQVVAPGLTITVGQVRIDDAPPARRDRELQRLATEEARRVFDLRRGPLLRATVVSRSEIDHVILLTLHHIVADGWSVGVFVRELSTLYGAFAAGRPSPLPELTLQYADFAVWQREHLRGERLDALLAYWEARLADLPVLRLPTDKPRPRVLDYQGAFVPLALSDELSDGVRDLARRGRATPFMVLMAGFVALLQRYTGQDDIAVGTAIANRNRAETEGLIGFFVNSLLIRCDASGRPTFTDLVERVRGECLDAYTHQDLPFERLVEHLQPERDLGRNPLFQVTFQLVNAPTLDGTGPAAATPALEVKRGSAIFDLAVTLMDGTGPFGGIIEYSTQLFEPATIARFAAHYRKLLAAVVADPRRCPSEVALTTARERAALSAERPAPATPPRPVVVCVRAAAGAAPSVVAVRGADGDLTAAELLAGVDVVAGCLAAAGIGPGSRVGLYLDHSTWTPVAMLAVLASGAAYVPLDPDYPAERTAFMLDDSASTVVVTERRLVADLPGRATIVLDDDAPAPEPSPLSGLGTRHEPLDGAYVIYTSGSTGAPRGVVVPRLALDNHMEWMARAFPLLPEDRVLQRTSPCFDASVWEFFAPLIAGAQLVVLPGPARRDPAAIAATIVTAGITVLQVVPSLLRALLEEPDLLAASELRRVFCGGEVLTADLRDRFHASCRAELVNLYGPTEATIDATAHVSTPGDRHPTVPIGRPVDGVDVHVLDGACQPVPIGVPGRLHLGGVALALGYTGHPAATAERFAPDPFTARPGARLYDTGDVARFRADGELEFLGRADSQAKIRGFRVEPAEVERVIERAPGIRECVVTATADDGGEAQLVGYLVPDAGGDLDGIVDEAEDDVIARWQEVYGQLYAAVRPQDDVELNIVGWNSSIDGAPLSAAEMAGWRDETVARIRELGPRAVLEIGCGTGLILGPLAPDCDRYVGTDFSAPVIDLLATKVAAGSPLAHVELHQRRADDLADFEGGGFDVVVLNSVVQYFPGVGYLRRVLEQAVRCVRPGGAVFVGDVRNLALLEAFHLQVELARAGDGAPIGEMLATVERRRADEEELLLEPGFFTALADEVPAIERCDIRVKGDRHDNEMTWFRYDAVLRTAPDRRPEVAAQRVEWQGGMTAAVLGDRLAVTAADAVVVEGVPDRRLAPLLTLLDDGQGTVDASGHRGLTPADLEAVAAERGWDARLAPCADRPGWFDAAFLRGAARHGRVAGQRGPQRGGPLANDPLRAAVAALLLPGVRAELARLPDHLVPSRFLLLDAIPRLPNGKLDRYRLPDPFLVAERRTRYVDPADPLEQLLADVWSDVTGVGRVGTADDFFTELGGHSLLATRLVARLRAVLRCDVPLRLVFEAPTIAELARALMDSTPAGERVARLADRVERLSDAEVAAWLDGAADGDATAKFAGERRAHG